MVLYTKLYGVSCHIMWYYHDVRNGLFIHQDNTCIIFVLYNIAV